MKKKSILLGALLLLMFFVGACGGTANQTADPVDMVINGVKTQFYVGDEFFIGSNAEVKVLRSDETEQKISPADYSVDRGGFKKGVTGKYTVTLTLKAAPAIKKSYEVTVSHGPYTEDFDEIKVLAIGNSFSEDATAYMYGIFEGLGIDNINVTNIWIGSCSLSMHMENASNDRANYDYMKNTDGTWQNLGKTTIKESLQSEDWDYIAIQQVSGLSGKPETHNNDLKGILDYINTHKNKDAKIVWHMTWAYQADSNHSDFPKYSNDQIKMYQAITNTVKSKVLPNLHIYDVVPAGTAIQNLRGSFIGDTLTRDGYHLSNFGRYVAGLMWAKTLTGMDIDSVNYKPQGVDINEKMLQAAKDAVNKAFDVSYSTTESAFQD